MRQITITGASGFLGAAVCRLALADGWHVVAVTRRPWVEAPKGAENRVGELDDSEAVKRMIEGSDVVVHCAGLAHQRGVVARRSRPFQDTNVALTRSVCDASCDAGVPRVVCISSVSVYGSPRRAAVENDECIPASCYAKSKLDAEQVAVDCIGRSASTKLAILRLTTLYGPGDPGNVMRLIQSVDRGKFVWLGDGSNRKTLLHVNDAAIACLKAATGRFDGIFNVSAEPLRLKEIIFAIGEVLRCRPRLRIPAGVVLATSSLLNPFSFCEPVARMVADVERLLADDVYDDSLFRRCFEFSPSIPFSLGIAEEVAWYKRLSK